MSKEHYGRHALMKALEQIKDRLPVNEIQYGYVFNDFLFAKNKTLFRPLGVIDWAWYTSATLKSAILEERMGDYYTEMLNDSRSPSNIWKDKKKEKKMKEYYANRYSSEGV